MHAISTLTSLFGHLPGKLGHLLAMTFEKHLQIFLIGFKLVDALEVVVATNHFVGHIEAAQKFRRRFMAQRRTRI